MLTNHKLAEDAAFFNGRNLFKVWEQIENICFSYIIEGNTLELLH